MKETGNKGMRNSRNKGSRKNLKDLKPRICEAMKLGRKITKNSGFKNERDEGVHPENDI